MRFDALRIVQPSGREVFAFAARPADLINVVQIPNVGRDEEGELFGYQRPEVVSHIAEIRRYLETDDAVLPNAIVVAFDERARFEPSSMGGVGQTGVLDIPEQTLEGRKCGFVVDGQQRLAAVASSRHDGFPIFVTAMIAATEAEQRKQFVLVNRTKPLPAGLVFELLPEVEGCLPSVLAKQQLSALLTVRLNTDPQSSLRRTIRTPTFPVGVIKDNSIRRLVLNSLSDGALGGLQERRGDDRPRVRLLGRGQSGVRRSRRPPSHKKPPHPWRRRGLDGLRHGPPPRQPRPRRVDGRLRGGKARPPGLLLRLDIGTLDIRTGGQKALELPPEHRQGHPRADAFFPATTYSIAEVMFAPAKLLESYAG